MAHKNKGGGRRGKGTNDGEENSYRVGYGHPPEGTRFQKGHSGNPKGRPRGRKNLGTLFLDALHRKIEVREGDRVRSMPKIEAAIEVTLNKALKGDHRSFAKLMDVADKLGTVELPPEPIVTTIVREIIGPGEKLSRLIDACAKAEGEAAIDEDAPPGCNTKTDEP
jgi:hypothetical protein